jgi:hypothetical protein
MDRLLIAGAALVTFGACQSDKLTKTPGRLDKAISGVALTNANEVPPVTTTSTGAPTSGTANLLIIDTNTVRVQTLVTAIDSVTQAHIHAGDAQTAGPIMVFLAGTYPSSQGGIAKGTGGITTLTGVLSHVDIIRGATVFRSPYTFDSLLTRIRDGTAYVNVHTRKNGGGEIRGQIPATAIP